MSTLMEQLSGETTALVEEIRPSIVTVGAGKATPRTGLVIGPEEVVTVAMVAEEGESVPVHHGSTEIQATVTGFDSASGIALLRAPGLESVPALARALPKVGEIAVTVAAPIPDDVEARFSMIRCVGGATRLRGGRRVGSYIQTDAARFRGFSASVVVNYRGEAVGMTMPVQRREEPFVLPMSEILTILEEVRSGESVGTGYLGVQTTAVALPRPVDGAERGLLITGVEEESPAERAGLAVGTFLIKVGENRTSSVEELYDSLVGVRKGDTLTVTVASSEGTSRTHEVEVELRS